MNSIIDNQRPILLSVEGTNIWSGQQPQQYNSQAIAWGGLRYLFFQSSPSKFVDDHFNSHQLFAVGKRYQFVAWAYLIGFMVPVPFWIMYRLWPKLRTDYLYTPVIWCVEHIPFITICWSIYGSYYIGWLCVGINSSILSFFSVAFLSQWWLRTRYPRWFNKYNYVVAAALDGGTQVRINISSHADIFIKPSWTGHGFHPFIRSSRSVRWFSLVYAMVIFFLLPCLVIHKWITIFRWGANQGGWYPSFFVQIY